MGQTNSRIEPTLQTNTTITGCPVPHDKPTSSAQVSESSKLAKCPVDHDPSPKPAQCPVDHENINPLNQMPTLSQDPAKHQAIQLPITRTESSIPRDESTKWEYPSPQQFYNALVRKGWETPEEHVETMVEIHNFLNEEAWEEVRKWEKRHGRYGFCRCLRLHVNVNSSKVMMDYS